MKACACPECDEPCDQYAEPGSSSCYDCNADEHVQDRE